MVENYDLPEYEFEEIEEEGKAEKENKNRITNYTGVQSAGFKDFLLKPELQRAIQDCGFEHPSEI